MKRILTLSFAAVIACMSLDAQIIKEDWPAYSRYKAQNDSIIAAQKSGQAAKPKAVLFGDSLTEVWQMIDSEFIAEHGMIGRGISGQGTAKALARIRRDVIDLQPEYAVILIGTNDLACNDGYMANENIFGNIVSMTEILRANGIIPVLCSLLPSNGFGWRPEVGDRSADIRKLNDLLREYAKSQSLKYIDYYSALVNEKGGMKAEYSEDDVHENAAGLKVMEEIFLREMSDCL